MLRLLGRDLGYTLERQEGTSHKKLTADGRPSVTFAFHDGRSLSPIEVRDILVRQVGLSVTEALEVARRGR
jgi:hypothetical protein